jgi:polysaccharide deacetylase 2 family uncharacterized protein YibQ
MARKRKASPWKLFIAALFAAAVVLFVAGEAFLMTRSDTGRIRFARTFGFVDQPELTHLVSRQLHRAFAAAGIPADSVRERTMEDGPVALRWTAGLKDDGSLLQANYALTRTLEEAGAEVLAGREEHTAQGGTRVILTVGLPHRPTHEVVLTLGARSDEPVEKRATRVAIVVYGFPDDGTAADSVFALPEPFAVALLPAAKNSAAVFKAAHHRQREVVLLLPLEPVNYPQVNPGPGTLLVTMKPTRIAESVDRYLDQAGAVSAVANHMGSLATQDMTVMTAVYRTLRQHRVPFVHLMPAAGAVCKSLASEMGVAYVEPGAVIENEPRAPDARALDKRWKAVIQLAHTRGEMTVWIRLTPLSRRWLARALDRNKLPGVDLVPLESLVRHPPPA